MAIADIESLCAAYCELEQLKAPSLVPGTEGLRAMTIPVDGIDVYAQQPAGYSSDEVFLSVDLGEADAHREHAVWQALLLANLHLAGAACPVFSRNPRNGRAMLQWAYPLQHASAPDFRDRLRAMAGIAQRWRADSFLDDPQAAFSWLARTCRPRSFVDGATRAQFAALCEGLRQLVGGAPNAPGMPQDAPAYASAITLRTQGREVRIVHPGNEPDSIYLILPAGEAAGASVEDAQDMMELNWRLATQSPGVRVCLNEAAGTWLMVQALPLRWVTAPELLQMAQRVASVLQQAEAENS